MKIILTLFLGLFFFGSMMAQDQEHKIRGSGEFGAGLGFGRVKFSADSKTHSDIGIIFHMHLGSRGFHFAVDVDPYRLRHPSRSEEFSATTFLFAFKLFRYKQVYVQPGFGFQYRWWYGSDKRQDTNFGFAFRLGVGYRYPVSPKFSVHPEIFYRTSVISEDDNMGTSGIGIQVAGAWGF
jgi:hypothetical protein